MTACTACFNKFLSKFLFTNAVCTAGNLNLLSYILMMYSLFIFTCAARPKKKNWYIAVCRIFIQRARPSCACSRTTTMMIRSNSHTHITSHTTQRALVLFLFPFICRNIFPETCLTFFKLPKKKKNIHVGPETKQEQSYNPARSCKTVFFFTKQ